MLSPLTQAERFLADVKHHADYHSPHPLEPLSTGIDEEGYFIVRGEGYILAYTCRTSNHPLDAGLSGDEALYIATVVAQFNFDNCGLLLQPRKKKKNDPD